MSETHLSTWWDRSLYETCIRYIKCSSNPKRENCNTESVDTHMTNIIDLQLWKVLLTRCLGVWLLMAIIFIFSIVLWTRQTTVIITEHRTVSILKPILPDGWKFKTWQQRMLDLLGLQSPQAKMTQQAQIIAPMTAKARVFRACRPRWARVCPSIWCDVLIT